MKNMGENNFIINFAHINCNGNDFLFHILGEQETTGSAQCRQTINVLSETLQKSDNVWSSVRKRMQ